MKATVHVTAEDIKDGDQSSCFTCPIALAAKRAFPDYLISVLDGSITVASKANNNYWIVNLPLEATAFIRAFDNAGEGRPFSFILELD